MQQLQPAILKDKYWIRVEKLIQHVFFDVVYKDLFKLTKQEQELYNAKDPLSIAILSARVGFDNGSFFGKFNSTLTKELRAIGAKYDKSSRTWKLSTKDLPPTIQAILAQRDQKDASLNSDAISVIDNVDINKAIRDSGIDKAYNATVRAMSLDIDKTLGIKFALSVEQQEIIAKEWTNNLDLYIKDFLEVNITELRKDVLANTARGQRAGNLVKAIESRFGVTKSKAKFLARQEASLLMSKMRETRYKAAGLPKYKWSTAHDERVRSRHKELNGQEFFWSEPPIVDDKGNRANPGEDFNCRCLARPVIE